MKIRCHKTCPACYLHTFFVGDGLGNEVLVHNEDYTLYYTSITNGVYEVNKYVACTPSQISYILKINSDRNRGATVTGTREHSADITRIVASANGDRVTLAAIADLLTVAQQTGSAAKSYIKDQVPRWWKGDADASSGPCGAWTSSFLDKLNKNGDIKNAIKLKMIVLSDISWNVVGGRIWSGHNAIQVELFDESGKSRCVFYIDNESYGGKDHVFFPEDIKGKLADPATILIQSAKSP